MKILMIGNSHTFYNDMPEMLRLMAQSRGLCLEPVQNTSGGKDLSWHANQPDVRFNILYGRYDAIVLQHLAHPFPGQESLLSGAGRLMPYIERTASRVYAYMPWSEQDNPAGQAIIAQAHRALAERWPAITLAPAGLAWEQVRHAHPDIGLYYRDGRHASPLGSYLAAAALFCALTGQSARGLPARLDLERPTFAGLDLENGLTQDFNCPTVYDLNPDACRHICLAVDRVFGR